MPLTPAQKLTLRTNIQANTAQLAFEAGNAQVNTKFAASPLSTGDAMTIANWYNLQASPDYFVWKDLPMEDVLKLVATANMTPAATPPTTPDLSVQVMILRHVICQGKQLSFQGLTTGRTLAPMKTTSYRAALQDCLTNLPASADTSNTVANWMVAANWTGIRDAAKRLANNLERVFATGTGTQATPGDAAVEGAVTGDEISDIKGLPA